MHTLSLYILRYAYVLLYCRIKRERRERANGIAQTGGIRTTIYGLVRISLTTKV